MFVSLVLFVFCAAALVTSVLLAMQAYESSRMVKKHALYLARTRAMWGSGDPHVALIAPVKGNDLGLEDNLSALLRLDYCNYEVVFVVESQRDPAMPVLRRLIQRAQIPARCVVAGMADTCGQKIHNLLAAINSLGPHVEALAFVDADARPDRSWLMAMINSGLRGRKEVAVTGYRWMLPQRITLPNLILASMNASCAGMLGHHKHNLLWGGSWAILRRNFESLGIAERWHGSLSDDLAAAQVLRENGSPPDYEPGALCSSPIDSTWAEVIEFARRQFALGRFYTTAHWRWGLLATLLLQTAMWGGAVWAAIAAATGARDAALPACLAVSLYGLGTFRAWCRQSAAKAIISPAEGAFRQAMWFDILAWPVSGLLMLAIMLGSAVGRHLCWRGITYRLDRRGKILAMYRDDLPSAVPICRPAQSGSKERSPQPDRYSRKAA